MKYHQVVESGQTMDITHPIVPVVFDVTGHIS